ncbi:MAG TPA: ATP-binding protein, partial [Polyangia bacterium]|nr:ATP-binding protein [Polyangia bacterium]
MVTSQNILALLIWAGHLAVGTLVLLQPLRNPLVWPMGALAFNLFAWNFADFSFGISGRIEWHWLDLGMSPFSPAIALHLGATFVGLTRLRRATAVLFYMWATALASIAWMAFVWPAARRWIALPAWSTWFLAMDVSALVLVIAWLVSHARRVDDRDERARTRTMLAAVLVGGMLATTDFLRDLGVPLPPLANVGSLISAALLAMATLRFRIFGRNLSARLAVLCAALAAAGAAGYIGLFNWLSGNTAAVMVGTTALTLALLVAVRQLARTHFERRARLQRFAHMGRLSAQIAHDLKNPLAALRGAIQFLETEASRGRPLDAQQRFLALLVEQVDRLDGVIDGYARLGRIQPRPLTGDLNEIVQRTLSLQGYVRPDVAVEEALQPGLPACQVDAELVGRAIENVLRNAVEAMPSGGVLTVRTSIDRRRDRPIGARLTIQDTGEGMNARESARAFEDFFSTKPEGSGLGLGFVQRVMQAHGGRVDLTSKVGAGTSVT